MRKNHILWFFALLALFLLPIGSSANNQKQENAQGAGVQNQNAVQEQAATTSEDDNVVQNREREEVRVNEDAPGLQAREQERAEVGGMVTETSDGVKTMNKRSEQAREHMSIVAQKVEQLLVATGTAAGGIGEQVRVFAQEQNQIRQAVSTSLEKVEKRGGFLKTLIGPNYQALKDIKTQMTQNEVRIRQLEQLREKVSVAAQGAVDEAIQAMKQETETLRLRVQEEEGVFSFFGWFAKLFAK